MPTIRETRAEAVQARTGTGRVKAVRGAVLDIEFEPGTLPAIDDAVSVLMADQPRCLLQIKVENICFGMPIV